LQKRHDLLGSQRNTACSSYAKASFMSGSLMCVSRSLVCANRSLLCVNRALLCVDKSRVCFKSCLVRVNTSLVNNSSSLVEVYFKRDIVFCVSISLVCVLRVVLCV